MTDRPTRDCLPGELTDRNQWVCWQTEDRDGKATKVPIDPSTGRFASTTDPSTWSSFDDVCDYAHGTESVDGIGFVFTEADPFVGVDIDGCRDPRTGRPTEMAKDIVDRLDSYTEVSPSGAGYHVIVRGELPEGRNRHGDVECYATSRYFTVTGDHVSGTPETVEERSEALAVVHREYVAVKTPEGTTEHRSEVTLGDAKLLEKATRAANGERFESLWNGATAGYRSHSEADMALCCHLAFWTGGDTAQMDRLFRESGLMREKWDEVHFADGSTYGEKTISRAAERVTEHYDPTATPIESFDMGSKEPHRKLGKSEQGRQNSAGTYRSNERLRATVQRLDERVKTLEAENQQLRDRLERSLSSVGHPDEAARLTESSSLWSRLKQLVRASEDESTGRDDRPEAGTGTEPYRPDDER